MKEQTALQKARRKARYIKSLDKAKPDIVESYREESFGKSTEIARLQRRLHSKTIKIEELRSWVNRLERQNNAQLENTRTLLDNNLSLRKKLDAFKAAEAISKYRASEPAS